MLGRVRKALTLLFYFHEDKKISQKRPRPHVKY
jgi:hypothetical protein